MPKGPNIEEARKKIWADADARDTATPEPAQAPEPGQAPEDTRPLDDAPMTEVRRRSKRGKKKRILVSLDASDMDFIERESVATGYAVAAIAAAHIKRDINRNKKI